MAKKNDILGDFLEVLGSDGGELLGDLLEQVTGNADIGSLGGDLLEGLSENGGNILQGVGDVFSDLTGLGSSNPDASETAQLSGKTKSSAAPKKIKKTTGSAKTKPEKSTGTSAAKAKETQKPAKTSSAKKKSSAAVKKSK